MVVDVVTDISKLKGVAEMMNEIKLIKPVFVGFTIHRLYSSDEQRKSNTQTDK